MDNSIYLLIHHKAINPKVLNCIKHLTNSNYPISITSLANDCNLSRRQFERAFKEYSGFSPKVFLNLVRFNSVIKAKTQANNSLTQIAIDCGYFDQSHFIHDFKTFSGYTPKEYFNQKIDEADYRASVEFKL
jgi:transcriptional regulator GlxA family with amidase domain